MIKKALLAIKTIKNLHVLFFDYLGLLNGDVIYLLRNGMKFIARGGTTDYSEIIINAGDSEYPSDLYPTAKNPVIIDAGANIGETAIFMYKRLQKNKPIIYALEPNSNNYSYLERNIMLNETLSIRPLHVALTDKTGIGKLNFNKNSFDGGFVNNVRKKESTTSEKICTTTLQDLCKTNKISNVDLIKMDIEGSEYSVFDTSMKFIKNNVKTIFVELHNISETKNYEVFKKNIIKEGFSIKREIMNRTLF